MEWKIGEIRQINGEWYQCINPKRYGCSYCDLQNKCMDIDKGKLVTCHARYRSDRKSVVFRKLEKVGEPFERNEYMYQEYKTYTYPLLMSGDAKIPTDNGFAVIIKQNQEDMEEKKVKISKEDATYLLNELHYILDERLNGEGSDKVIDNIKQLLDIDTEQSNLKPFNLEEAKKGKLVCTRDGRKVRIICFDAKDNLPIIALITNARGDESLARYKSNGRFTSINDSDCDLMMLTEKKEGWVNIYRGQVYNAFEKAEEARKIAEHGGDNCLKTIKIDWEE